MQLIVISSAESVSNEVQTLTGMLAQGAQVHIRKPDASEYTLYSLLEKLPMQYRGQLSLHGDQKTAQRFKLGGLHLKSNQSLASAEEWEGRLSKSYHAVEEIEAEAGTLDYCFLSPVFDSISKAGHRAAFDHEALKDALTKRSISTPVYALGGMNAERIPAAQALGFDGAAVLGTIWQENDHEKRMQVFEKLHAYA